MSAATLARRHFAAALDDARSAGLDGDALCRAMLGLVIAEYLQTRAIHDVQSELRFVAENCDPDSDFAFMRP